MTKETENQQNPSAPPPDFTETSPQNVEASHSPPPNYPAHPPPSYDQPPAYNEAISYPHVPPQNMPHPYTPQTQTPNQAHYPTQNYYPNPSPPVILSAPPPIPGSYPQSQPQHAQIIVTPVLECVWCRQGVVQNETDMCCLVCLIIVAILTFPFGLILLCCIPCTVHPRCTNCHRLQT